jgi:trimethylamine--corrinoid protein Co-methyltransferase
VRIPSGLIEWALATVPKRVTLANRDGQRVMPVEGHRVFFGPGSDCLNIQNPGSDFRENQDERSNIEDVFSRAGELADVEGQVIVWRR